MSRTSAYRLQIRTLSDDENAFLLLASGQLVAIIVELADEAHGDDRGKWIIEAIFGMNSSRVPDNFLTAAAAAGWVSAHICDQPFVLDGGLFVLA